MNNPQAKKGNRLILMLIGTFEHSSYNVETGRHFCADFKGLGKSTTNRALFQMQDGLDDVFVQNLPKKLCSNSSRILLLHARNRSVSR